MGDESATNVSDNADERRYEIAVGGTRAGFARYVRRGGRTIFVHTEIDPSFEGQGLGGKLVKAALDAERDAGRPVVPLCPFVRTYIERHPEYGGIVDSALLAAIDGDPSTTV